MRRFLIILGNHIISASIGDSRGILIYDEDICITKDFFEGKCQMNISNNEEKRNIWE